MRILFLTQIVPYPPDAGPKVKTWNVLRALVSFGHQVTLVTYTRPEEENNLDALREICEDVLSVPIKRSRKSDIFSLFRSYTTGRPFLVERDDLPGMREVIDQLIRDRGFDAIHADQMTMTQFARPYARSSAANGNAKVYPETVFDAHNAVWTILQRMSENSRFYLRPILSIERDRIKRYEGQIVSTFDHTLAVIENDREALMEASRGCEASQPPEIKVIPIAVDTEELQPVPRTPGSMTILTLGTLHYPPNADGIRWFLNEVIPQILARHPDAKLTIVGKNPPKDFLQAAAENPSAVEVTGYVPDLTPYFERAAVVVIPVRAGGGMRVRILEAFARAIPVVTTTIGLEGIDAVAGEHVLVADGVNEFAAAVSNLLLDPETQDRLSENSRKLVVEKYDWKVVLEAFRSIYP